MSRTTRHAVPRHHLHPTNHGHPTRGNAATLLQEMLAYCGLGVAMGHAAPAARAAADAVTLSNDEDGVARAIEEFVLRPRGIHHTHHGLAP